jgi:uncharacterized membrane protein YfcA
MDHPIILVALGLVTGAFIGFTGLGGGAVIVPMLVLLLGFDQKTAQGTSLSIILSPLQAPALYNYGAAGLIKWKYLLWIGPGVMVGSFFGSLYATLLPQQTLKIVFGLLMVYIGGYSLFSMLGLGRAVAMSLVLTVCAGIALMVARWLDRPVA